MSATHLDTIKKTTEQCKRCHAARHSTINLSTGQYMVDIPSCCTDKDRCHKEIKPEY